jgi:hypothetical protein
MYLENTRKLRRRNDFQLSTTTAYILNSDSAPNQAPAYLPRKRCQQVIHSQAARSVPAFPSGPWPASDLSIYPCCRRKRGTTHQPQDHPAKLLGQGPAAQNEKLKLVDCRFVGNQVFRRTRKSPAGPSARMISFKQSEGPLYLARCVTSRFLTSSTGVTTMLFTDPAKVPQQKTSA